MPKDRVQRLLVLVIPMIAKYTTAASAAKISYDDSLYQHNLLKQQYEALKTQFDASVEDMQKKQRTFSALDRKRIELAGAKANAEGALGCYEIAEKMEGDGWDGNDEYAGQMLAQAEKLEVAAAAIIEPPVASPPPPMDPVEPTQPVEVPPVS